MQGYANGKAVLTHGIQQGLALGTSSTKACLKQCFRHGSALCTVSDKVMLTATLC
jgi:hypothetical protein